MGLLSFNVDGKSTETNNIKPDIVFNYRRGRTLIIQTWFFITKWPNLKLKTNFKEELKKY
jgi:hypothetical protein